MINQKKWIYIVTFKVIGGATHYVEYYSSLKKARHGYILRYNQIRQDKESYEVIREHCDHLQSARGVQGTLAQLSVKHNEYKSTGVLYLKKVQVY